MGSGTEGWVGTNSEALANDSRAAKVLFGKLPNERLSARYHMKARFLPNFVWVRTITVGVAPLEVFTSGVLRA